MKEFARHGVDVALITAATPSAEPIELTASICRDRGRVVVMGTVDLGVSRQPMYMKELSLVLSRSYGPGRYDPQHEEEGVDYPIGYVRWTEKRNMEAFLELLASGAINVTPFIERRCSVEQGGAAYRELKDTGAYTVLLEYPIRALIAVPAVSSDSPQSVRARRSEELRIGYIGAGSFARVVIFPALRQSRGVALHSVATASGVAAESARRLFSFGPGNAGWRPASGQRHRCGGGPLSPATTAMRNTSLRPFPITSLFSWKNRWPSAEQLEEVKCAYRQRKRGTPLLF